MKIGESKHKDGSDIPNLEPGTYPAVLISLVDLGVHPQEDYKTKKPKKPAHKLLATFELPTEIIEIEGEEKPRVLSKDYTFSFHDKAALTKVTQVLSKSLSKKPKYLKDLLGVGCMLNVGQTGSGKAKISDVVPLVKGMPAPETQSDLVIFDLDNPDLEVFNNLHDWIKNKITGSIGFDETELAKSLNNPVEEEEVYEDEDNVEDEINFDEE